MHLPSKLHSSENAQYYHARTLRQEIEECETKSANKKSLLIGDFNMNPSEIGMVAFDGLHALNDKRIAAKMSRRIYNRRWDAFYNPMWSRMGDESAGPSGSYYYHSANPEGTYWSLFDQVVLRPELLYAYSPSSIELVTVVGGSSLLRRSRPDRSKSDHLPLLIRLNV